MITAFQSYIYRGRHFFRRIRVDPRFHMGIRVAAYLLSGFFLSAASLGSWAQPFTLGLLCAATGWPAVLIALGGSLGYLVFWGSAGAPGVLWMACGLLLALFMAKRTLAVNVPLLLPAAAGLVVAIIGLLFQFRTGHAVPVMVHFLRILLAMAATILFTVLEQRRGPIARWLAEGVAVLALAQVVPIPWLGLGFIAAGALCSVGSFPAAALAGLALDLAQVSPLPLTAVTCLGYFLRLIPFLPKQILFLLPGMAYLIVMGLCGLWTPAPLPGFLLGGLIGMAFPGQTRITHRRGETGIAQVRLEMVSGVFSQAQQLLIESQPIPIDENALLLRTAERACGSCPCRKGCKGRESVPKLSVQLLHKPLLDGHDLPVSCRKEGRLLLELRRSQEQLRSIRAHRQLQAEYRAAVIQQYQFLAEYLQDLSDSLGKRANTALPQYTPEVFFHANRQEADNGDRCQCFAGPGCRYYVLLCDGMGTGLGAIEEGKNALQLLKKLLLAGFPAEYALRSLNSLCALRGAAGAATVDLAELQLDTGKGLLYKWGAAPSYLLHHGNAERIGTAGPPPGLSVTEDRETVERLSLRRGEILVLLSDGVGGEDALRCWFSDPDESLGELAARILESGDPELCDDATVAVVRLSPESLSA